MEICSTISRAKRPTQNFTSEEREAFRELKEDETIQILQADKGSATVVMDTEEYDKKSR